MYLRQFSIVVVSAVLALDMIPTETRRKVWFSGHTPRYKLKAWYSGHIPRCKVAVLSQMRSATISLLLHAQLTDSTSSIDSQRPMRAMHKAASLPNFTLRSATPLQNSWRRPWCSVCVCVCITHYTIYTHTVGVASSDDDDEDDDWDSDGDSG